MSKTICFDLRPLQIGHENRGIGMVVKSILENLVDYENEYIFYVFDKSNPLEKLNIKPRVNYKIVETKTLNATIKKPFDFISSYSLIFHRFRKLKKYNPDVFIQFDFMLGLPAWRNTKTYTIAYDLIPLIMKREYLPSPLFAWNHAVGKKSKIKAVIRSSYYLINYAFYYRNYKKSNHVISISEATSNSFSERLKINHNKITTIPLAPVNSSDEIDTTILNRIDKPFIFYIGGTDSRKRVEQIVYAYNIVRSRGYDLQLVLAGSELKDPKTVPNNATRDAINSSPYKEDILLLGFISDAEKNTLYNNAHAFVFCSLYEGFGLPAIEAAANKCPIVAYNNSSIPEATGNAALLVESNNYVEVATQIIKLFDQEVRNTCIDRGTRQAKLFSWDKFVYRFLTTITK